MAAAYAAVCGIVILKHALKLRPELDIYRRSKTDKKDIGEPVDNRIEDGIGSDLTQKM